MVVIGVTFQGKVNGDGSSDSKCKKKLIEKSIINCIMFMEENNQSSFVKRKFHSQLDVILYLHWLFKFIKKR